MIKSAETEHSHKCIYTAYLGLIVSNDPEYPAFEQKIIEAERRSLELIQETPDGKIEKLQESVTQGMQHLAQLITNPSALHTANPSLCPRPQAAREASPPPAKKQKTARQPVPITLDFGKYDALEAVWPECIKQER
ncbi:hypothetical protein Ndes2526B_g05043 [Nannochloris sp. 'desiccata']|nr:hypothetical protein NADE_008069 [Chlorella desiccata (nom. nud.)]